jgi:outer membrane protein assembly factor BamB
VSNLLCLDAITGRVLWQNDLPKQYQTKDDLRGFNCSPIVEGKLIIIAIAKSPQASIVAFDKESGRQVWESLDEIPSDSSPIVITAAGRTQIIVWAYKSVAALDPATGQILWRQAVNAGPAYTVATPVWKEDWLLLGGLMLKLTSDKPGVSILWPEDMRPSRIHVSDTSTPLIQDGLVFSPTGKGQLLCLEAATGKHQVTVGLKTLEGGIQIVEELLPPLDFRESQPLGQRQPTPSPGKPCQFSSLTPPCSFSQLPERPSRSGDALHAFEGI